MEVARRIAAESAARPDDVGLWIITTKGKEFALRPGSKGAMAAENRHRSRKFPHRHADRPQGGLQRQGQQRNGKERLWGRLQTPPGGRQIEPK